MQTDNVDGRRPSRRIMVGTAVLVALSVAFAAWSLSHFLLGDITPEEVLSRYIDCVNEGDAEEAVGLTIYALMDQNDSEKETGTLVEWMGEKGEYQFELVSVENIACSNLSRHDSWVIGQAIMLLETEYQVEFEHSYAEACGLRTELVLHEGDVGTIEISTMFLFVKTGSTWYLIDGVS